MRRAIPYIAALLLALLIAAVAWWAFRSPAPAPMPRVAHPTAPNGIPLLPLLAAVLAGAAGGALSGWLIGLGPGRRVEQLSARLAKLEREQRSAAQRHEQASRILASVGTAERGAAPTGELDPWSPEEKSGSPAPRASRPTPFSSSASRPADLPPEYNPQPQAEPIEEITARFGRIAAGQISRSGFARFFEDLGPSGGVRADRSGTGIAPDPSGEALLTSVNSADRILVFPSYEFVSNQPTQFATIASVPDEVASLFDLSRGDGDLVLLRPAVFEEVDGEARRVSKGELGGFAG